MSIDLEHDLRRALRARVQHITPDQLRYPLRPRPVPARGRRWPAAGGRRWRSAAPLVAAAAVVAVIGLVVAVALGTGGTGSAPPAGGGTGASLAGTAWTLQSVRRDGHAAVPIPSRLSAGITFESARAISAQDGVNFSGGNYSTTPSGDLVIGQIAVTAAGYAGHDAAVIASMNGIGAILQPTGGASHPPVTVTRSGGRLELAANGYTLVLGDEVAVAPSSTPPLSPTPRLPVTESGSGSVGSERVRTPAGRQSS